jgi:predicted site-specific integrase-resolvase
MKSPTVIYSVEVAQAIARDLDYLTEQDICQLCSITAATAEAWRKRHKGPAYALAGNRVLYPKAAVRAFLESQIRRPVAIAAKTLL